MDRRIAATLFFALATLGPAVAQEEISPLEEFAAQIETYDDVKLNSEATALKSAIEAKNTELSAAEEALAAAAEDQKAEPQAALDALKAEHEELCAQLQALVKVMGDRELEVGEYQILLTESTGEIKLENVSAEMVGGLEFTVMEEVPVDMLAMDDAGADLLEDG